MHSLRTALIALWRSASGTIAVTRTGHLRRSQAEDKDESGSGSGSRSRGRSWSSKSGGRSSSSSSSRLKSIPQPLQSRTSPEELRHCTLFVSLHILCIHPHPPPTPGQGRPVTAPSFLLFRKVQRKLLQVRAYLLLLVSFPFFFFCFFFRVCILSKLSII